MRFTLAIALAVLAVPTLAQDTRDAARLYDALRLGEIIVTMQDEGLIYGAEVTADLFQGQAPTGWTEAVAAIYDADRMQSEVMTALQGALNGKDVTAMIAFFTTEPGVTISLLEASARAAFLDQTVEDSAKEAAAVAMGDQTPRYGLITRFIEANDLIETNVVSAMNANFAFYDGLMLGGAMEGRLSQDDMLAEVWAQEPEIRTNTTEWVYSFLLMAYDPLPDADIEAYIAFSETPAGKQMNNAIFSAFDGMFSRISRDMGMAAAGYMVTDEL